MSRVSPRPFFAPTEGEAALDPGDDTAVVAQVWDEWDSSASEDDEEEGFDFEIDDEEDFDLEVEDEQDTEFLDDLFGDVEIADGQEPESEPDGSPDASDIDLRPEQRMAIELAYDGIDDKSFYEILLLPRTAEQKSVKRAYYRLSKEYHPDKFYRKNLGPYKAQLEVIFNKITEAYRILSDVDSRADYDDLVFGKDGKDAATLTEASTTVDFVPDAVRKRQANQEAKQKATERKGKKKKGRAVFMQKFQKQIVMRIAKAKRHMTAGETALERGDHAEASSNFQMAMTLDPRNTRAKTLFKRSQAHHRNGKAEEFFRQAQEVMLAEDTKRAAEFMQKAVDCKPTKGKYYHEFGKLVVAHTLQQRVGLELLRKAVELEPRNVNFNIELARAYEELGMPSNAIRAFERVLHLDRKNSEATKALKRLK
jgi:curved DNA-binding protein CbpA